MALSKKCEFCDKRGLPLLLVRDAVAHVGSGAPRTVGPTVGLPGAIAHYTKRLLRTGYVNLFDEARRRWETYFVTPDGYFAKLFLESGAIPEIPRKPFNCPDEGHRALASCITIPDPMNASKVWIGFSDVLWTDSVRKANEDLAYRQLHMTEVDVKRALKGNYKPHSKIIELTDMVAEYATVTKTSKVNIGWSPSKFNDRQHLSDRLKKECESLRPGSGLIVTLSDPVAIVQELTALMKLQVLTFVEKSPIDKRNLAASAAIEQVKEAVTKAAVASEIAAAETLKNKQVNGIPLGYGLSDERRKKLEEFNKVTPADLHRAAVEAWKKYENKFDDKDRQLWLAGFNQRFFKFDKENIEPLAHGHVQWMKSRELASYFECNYDPKNSDSGAVYTQVFIDCITDTQHKKCCADLYEEWLDSDIAERSNILLRAFILNQSKTAEEIKKATTVQVALAQLPWDNILAVHNKAIERLSSATQDVSAHLVAQLGGPLMKMLNKVMDGSARFRAAMMSLGIVAGQPVMMVDVVDSARNFEKYLTKVLLEQYGRPLNENRLRQLVRQELKRLEIHRGQSDQTARRRWVIMIDQQTVKDVPNNLRAKQTEKWIARGVKSVQEIEGLNLNRWRNVINVNVRQGTVAAILQGASLMKLLADEEKSLKDEKKDAAWRRQAGTATICATLAEVFGHALASRAAQGMKFAQGLALVGNFLKTQAPRAGMLAGFVMAGLDFKKAFNEHAEGSDAIVVGAYAGSGLASILLAVALVSAWAFPIICLLLALAIGIGILIEFVKDNPIQDWLERCPWGKLVDQRYANIETEQAEFQLALR